MEFTLNIKRCDMCNVLLSQALPCSADGIPIHLGMNHLDVYTNCFLDIEKLLKELHEKKLNENLLNRRS